MLDKLKKNMKTLSAGFVLITLGLIPTAALSHPHEQCVTDCNQALDKADEHIIALEDLMRDKNLLIRTQEQELVEIREHLVDELKRRESWYNNPFIGVAGGLVLGIIVMGVSQ